MSSLTIERYAKYAADPAAFRNDLLIDVDGVARKFGDVMEPWQRADFAAIDPALVRCVGRSDSPAKTRAYYERPRGHSKTTDLAVICCWALAFAQRPVRGYAFAADRDQAGLLKDACETLVRLNPWLALFLDVQKNLVLNIAAKHPAEGGKLDIFTSDVASSYGINPDFIIADELTHWEGDGSLWHSLISSAAKRSNCLLAVISNAGFADSWQWSVREAARTDDAWYFSRLDGPQASWMTDERLAEQRRMLPHVAFARLWLNEWSTGGGDALQPSDIDAAFDSKLQPMTARHLASEEWRFVAGVDLGITRDCSAVVVLAVPSDGVGFIRLARNKIWKPVPGKKVDLLDVQRHILELDAELNLEFCSFDPWQAEHLAATLEADSQRRRRNQRRVNQNKPWCREMPPTASNLREQASLTIECFQDRRLTLYPCDALRRDLMKLRVEEKPYGFRLTSPRDGEGHGDTFSAFAIALVVAHELSAKRKTIVGGGFIDHRGGPMRRGTAWNRWQGKADARDEPFQAWLRQVAPNRFRR